MLRQERQLNDGKSFTIHLKIRLNESLKISYFILANLVTVEWMRFVSDAVEIKWTKIDY